MYRIHLFGYLLFVKWLWNLLNEDNNCSSDINCSFISLSFQFLMFLICYHGPIIALLASEKGKKFDRLVTRTRIIKKVCGFVYLIVFFCNFSLFRNEPQSGQITVCQMMKGIFWFSCSVPHWSLSCCCWWRSAAASDKSIAFNLVVSPFNFVTSHWVHVEKRLFFN